MSLLFVGFASISLLAVFHMLYQLITHNNKRTKSGDISAVVAVVSMIGTIITTVIK